MSKTLEQFEESFEKFKANDYRGEGSQKAYFGGGYLAGRQSLVDEAETSFMDWIGNNPKESFETIKDRAIAVWIASHLAAEKRHQAERIQWREERGVAALSVMKENEKLREALLQIENFYTPIEDVKGIAREVLAKIYDVKEVKEVK